MRNRCCRDERGQVLLWVALALPILILFTAMAVDMGVIYMTKARLANATDAAVLTGVKTVAYWTTRDGTVAAGQADAQHYASQMFAGNFGSSAPTLTYTWCPGDASCPANTTSLKLHASTVVNTTFMSYLPRWAQWTVGAASQATRGNLVMTLILDRSGSMTTDGGEAALKNAVPAFIADFSEGTDHVSMISFASDATINVPMTQTFTTAIDNAVTTTMPWGGGTFGTGAGTYGTNFDATHGPPLSMADSQNKSVTFPAGSSEEKVVVYFTDGLMNTIQETFAACSGLPNKGFYNFGGHDAVGVTPDFLDPTNSDFNSNDYSTNFSGNASGGATGGCDGNAYNATCQNNPPYSLTARCLGVTGFTSQIDGTFKSFSGNQAAVTKEAQYRAIYTANQMRSESPAPTYVFVIGLSSAMNDQCTEAFLATLANDPDGSQYSCPTAPAVYNSSLPQGEFLPVVNCPSSTCTQSLNQAFQKIAARILLRLSQ